MERNLGSSEIAQASGMEVRPPPERQEPIHEAIAGELIALIPERWRSLRLRLSRTDSSASGAPSVAHVISSPEGHRSLIRPSDELFQQTHALDSLFRDHGCPWKTAEYLVSLEPEGDWKWDVSF